MELSEFIVMLQDIEDTHGDMPVTFDTDDNHIMELGGEHMTIEPDDQNPGLMLTFRDESKQPATGTMEEYTYGSFYVEIRTILE